MTYGHLTVACGPMSSGKTTEILKRVLWAKTGEGKIVRLFKPALDDRYSITDVVSHDGLRAPAESVTELPYALDADIVVLDEMQFFDISCVDWAKRHLEAGVDVIAGGLDMDWQGQPFAVSASLIAMADEVVKKAAYCTICGKPATKTMKMCGSSNSIQIGGFDQNSSVRYEARCNKHWNRGAMED